MEKKDTNRANQISIEKKYIKGVKLIDIDTTIAEYMSEIIIPDVEENEKKIKDILIKYSDITTKYILENMPDDLQEPEFNKNIKNELKELNNEYKSLKISLKSKRNTSIMSAYIYKYKLDSKDKFVIVACDGLWDALSNQVAVEFIRDLQFKNFNGNYAKELAKYAIDKGSLDNVTVIVYFL